ncbi:protein of unknown function [Shewanella benthica]|uniref:Uncharacterized protein n=1 Tax=Shewanella benthica TaxID=43661 RepID=A0A330LW18_9GAMM|nr:protein of unknown function [Shewanella benthica]
MNKAFITASMQNWVVMHIRSIGNENYAHYSVCDESLAEFPQMRLEAAHCATVHLIWNIIEG